MRLSKAPGTGSALLRYRYNPATHVLRDRRLRFLPIFSGPDLSLLVWLFQKQQTNLLQFVPNQRCHGRFFESIVELLPVDEERRRARNSSVLAFLLFRVHARRILMAVQLPT